MAADFDKRLHRRAFLLGLAAVCTAAPLGAAPAPELSLAALIEQARAFLALSARIDFISRSLLGRRYQADTLIGGPRQQEVLVMREDRFDCVTFCEAVLAAAKAKDSDSYQANLRAIRYHNGAVDWRERNHDFAAWCERNIENKQCLPISLGKTVEVKKTIGWPRALGRRHYTIAAIPREVLFAQVKQLMPGDLIGFVSRRANLDYFHTGFIAFGGKGELLLRHASQSHRKVVDEPMKKFCAANRVRWVTLLRPVESAA